MSETPDQPLTDDDIESQRTTSSSGTTDADSTDAPGQGTGETGQTDADSSDAPGSGTGADSDSSGGDSVDSDSSDQS